MGSPDQRPAPRAAGDVLDGRYRLVDRLGHGGFGDVWRAEELLPDGAPFREVALKLLLAGGADAVDWAEEAKLLASFRHPSLVTIYAAGILDDAQRFVAMELLEGTNLADLLRARGPVPWRRVLRWAASAAGALDLIHAAGVVHLDLKPANLFLSGDGALKVLDFGIARRAGVASVVTHGRRERLPAAMTAREAELATGLFIADRAASSHDEEAFAATRPVGDSGDRRVVIGTPGFMAPEVLELAEPTAAADAYALAVCVVQLATGHLPHAAPDEPTSWEDPTAVSYWLDALRTATLRGALRPLLEGPAGLPRGLGALLVRLLSVDPVQRRVVPGQLGALFDEVWERPHGVPDPPYFGLAPFPPEGEGLLFGRDDDIARLGRELTFEPAVVLQGPVEAGKSSLAVAGLVPYLARSGADGKDDWIAVAVGASADPDAALDAALARVAPAFEGFDDLVGHCHASRIGLVLLVDPLDALVRAPSSRLAALCEAIASGPTRPGLRLVATVGDEAAQALLATPLGASLRAALRFVGAPATAAVKDIVAAPATFAGAPVFGVDAIAADVQRELRGGGVRLPYIALALAEWWTASAREAARQPPPSGAGKSSAPPSSMGLQGGRWRASGGVRGAVVRHAERVFAALGLVDRGLAEELLLRLGGTDGVAVAWDAGELIAAVGSDAAGPDDAAVRRVLAALEREHLVRTQRGVVEIGHEALLLDWPALASARLAQMDRLSFLERLREARLAWERADNHRDFLLHGDLLDEVRAHAAWVARGLAPANRAFLDASRRRERLRLAARWAVAATIVLLLAGGVWVEHLLGQAQLAEAHARAAAIELEQLAELAARARRTDDAYHRVAFTAAAMERGSRDALLPLELAATAGNLARAQFLTLDPVDGAAFPWDDRFLLGVTSASAIAVVDFRPPEPDVIEDVDLDFDPDQGEPAAHFKNPAVRHLRPHDAPIVERVPFAFDTAFVTRAGDGEVKVFRLRDDGLPALAAVAPMRCAGAVIVAAAAPVLACATDRGLARWDLRRARAAPGEAVSVHAFAGNVADVSADGERVAALAGKRVLLWSPGEGREATYTAPRPVTQARWSPREPVLALLEGAEIEIVDARAPTAPLVAFTARDKAVDQVRWDEGGLDLAVCSPRTRSWRYLRSGGRARGDAPPHGDPCTPPRAKAQPEPLRASEDYAELGERDLGPHVPLFGWRLRRHRYLSRDLVLFDAGGGLPTSDGQPPSAPSAAGRLLRFEGRDDLGGEELRGDNDSVVAVERDDSAVMFQVKDELRFYALREGARLFTRKGNFLRRCADGRYLSWIAEGAVYRVFDAWVGSTAGLVPRAPGLVLGADAACATLYTQRLDGVILAQPLAGGAARELAAADGYVYDARPSARGAAGLLLALGSGAVARLDDARGAVHVLGYATPQATAIADGPRAGEVVFADATGVGLLRPGAPTTWLRDGVGAGEWEDLSVAPDGDSMLLASEGRIAVLDLLRHEVLGSIAVEGRGRLSRWDDDGSVLAWSFGRAGGADGVVIPRGVALARAVSTAVSNLTVEKGRLTIRR
jgi:serine/threonine protein kinase